jgi:GAF domain-containing protein
MEQTVSEEKNKEIRGEQTLAKVLEAAYVMQERNRALQKAKAASKPTAPVASDQQSGSRPGVPPAQNAALASKVDAGKPAKALTLAQIVEIQHQIQVRHLELESVMSLVAERLAHIDETGGAAIGLVEGKQVHYPATAGAMALPVGTRVALEKTLGADCLRTGQVLRCPDVKADPLLSREECNRRGIQSMIAVPIFQEGAVAGTLERYFDAPRDFTDEEVHTCQLMAGLVSDALARKEEVDRKKSLANERATMLQALEKLKPSLAALADTPPVKNLAAAAGASSAAGSASTFVCRDCGHELIGQEQFCGNCGSPRNGDHEIPNLQSKIASLWHMQQAMTKTAEAPADRTDNGRTNNDRTDNDRANNDALGHDESLMNRAEVRAAESMADSVGEQLSEPLPDTELSFPVAEPMRNKNAASAEPPLGADFENIVDADLEIPPQIIVESDGEPAESTALAKHERSTAWSSAATTLDFFQQLKMAKDRGVLVHFWNARRGDIYLAVAAILLGGVVWWGIWSGNSVSATGGATVSGVHHRTSPDADLSLFDRILINVGLADPPDPPEYKGNPRTQVWLDVGTALYYCPGTDLYGKTPKGKFSSQRAAQLDQFEPAYRKPCD